MKKYFVIPIVLTLLALVLAFGGSVVQAQTTTPPTAPLVATAATPAQTSQAIETYGLDLVLLMAITAFFKTQMKLTGYAVMGAAFVIGLLIFLEPNIAALFPSATLWVEGVYAFLKLWFGGMGTYDFFKSDPPKTAPTPTPTTPAVRI